MFTLLSLGELAEVCHMGPELYLRYSHGPEADAGHASTDHESGLLMPGLSANPLAAPKWWTLPVEDWLARRVCQYLRETHEGARPWVLHGRVVDFGPDNEPLLVEVNPVAWLDGRLVAEAHARYTERMNVGKSTH
ncbi:DUF6098 family protein [Actinokineospora fastidiosa]|uniref:Uncharacterized protein n=1 Tax=Actinokineospora fastidiosa TaxID=1816 RepID=A0A918GNC2_9PSEU|nr:DUF6098 family protein [Actinokineospora fastidiosa]GGS47099.1 hypothetical protein GCM10010171_47900 [Actinokineospora fastidiosa]